MRQYKNKAYVFLGELADYFVKIDVKSTTDTLREEYRHYADDDIHWGKIINEELFYSDDELFNTEKEDATHLVIFLK
jgi:hypothetical protein